MANSVPSRFGSADGGSDKTALFLKVFAGEVLTAFAETNVAMSRHMLRTIPSGKSAQFPSSWKGTASYHTPGTELVGTAVGHNERVITIDDLLVADRFIANIDEAMTHYDVRSEYSRDVGRALAKTFDQNVLQVAILAARASGNITGAPNGTAVTAATSRTDATALIGALVDALQAMDEKDVPDEDRSIFLLPAQYWLLVESGNRAVTTDLNPEGNGSLASGKIYRIGGAELVKTNNLPQTDVTTGPTAYQGDFQNTSALVMHRTAVGTVKLIDLAVEMEYDIRRQGTLIVGKYAVGHGILRPESAVEVKVA